MKITEVEVIPLYAPKAEVVKSTCVVRVRTDEGIDGIGQVEAPALIIQAFIKTREYDGLEKVIKGEDPLQVEKLWHKMYASLWIHGRRGASIAAITGIDIALWDIKGKALGRPVSELIWSRAALARGEVEAFGPRKKVKPYGTTYPSGRTPDEVRKTMKRAVASGFNAVKLEEWEGGFGRVGVEHDVELVKAAREAIGDKRDLMIDVQYLWPDVSRAYETIKAIEKYRPYFIEAALAPDAIDAYAKLAQAVDVRIACGDGGFTTRYEFQELMDRGRVDVVQPSAVKAGGITEILQIAAMAYDRGILCIPHSYAWKIGVAAEIHLASVIPNMPYIEAPDPHPYSPFISELLVPNPVPHNGLIDVPRAPGLGFKLNEKTVEKYRVEAF